ncbi:MAG: flavin reductase family protein [Campylobacterota bacterium]|nr:flavin reductase family protein [Campylobacterota bacterium]
MLFDYSDKAFVEKYQLMSQMIIPRPIAWVVTENDGIVNIAPFSYFIGLSTNPATMLISVGHKKEGQPKDTLANLRRTKKCTICMIDKDFLELMHFSSKELDETLSEAEHFNIPTTRVYDDFPPMVAGVPGAFFCEFYQEIELKGSQTIPLIVEIKHQFVDDRCISDDKKMIIRFDPVARVGKSYALLGEEITPPKIP